MVHVMPTCLSCPLRIVFQQFDIEFVESPGSPHIDGIVLDLLNGGDAGQWQKETKMFGEIMIFGLGCNSGCPGNNRLNSALALALGLRSARTSLMQVSGSFAQYIVLYSCLGSSNRWFQWQYL